MGKLNRFMKCDDGATAIEYGLIAAATGLVLAAVLPAIESSLTGLYTTIAGGLTS